MSREEKTGHTSKDFSRSLNIAELMVKAPDKSINLKLKTDFYVNTESISVAGQIAEQEPQISVVKP